MHPKLLVLPKANFVPSKKYLSVDMSDNFMVCMRHCVLNNASKVLDVQKNWSTKKKKNINHVVVHTTVSWVAAELSALYRFAGNEKSIQLGGSVFNRSQFLQFILDISDTEKAQKLNSTYLKLAELCQYILAFRPFEADCSTKLSATGGIHSGSP
ncbi:unnamed protein product [Caenorhabditis nigoni]